MFAIKLATFSCMSNHVHTMVRIDREQARALQWSDEEVVDRRCKLFNGEVIVNLWRTGKLLSKTEEIVAKSMIEDDIEMSNH